ncbi:MAG: hypothetical protein EHM55_15955 [Acidobacteria bacterium]|nr:MAG: hypothetical protein EHM55_15955 [Acidobacteriota bacterium]
MGPPEAENATGNARGQRRKCRPFDEPEESGRFRLARVARRVLLPGVMEEHEVQGRFDGIDARFAEIEARFEQLDARFVEVQQLILSEGDRTRTHVVAVEKVQKVVLTEVRGLATKVDRLTRLRRGGLIPNP